MKKILITIILLLFLAVGGFFFMKAKSLKILPSQAEIGNSADPIALNSFKGIIDFEFERPVIQSNNEEISAGKSPFENIAQKQGENFTSVGNVSALTFAIIGDTQRFDAGNPNGNFQKAVAGIQKQNPDLVISVGDLVSNCKGKSDDAQDYANWKSALGALISKTYAVQGNHDRVEDVDKCDRFWTDAFNFPTNGPQGFAEFAYSFDVKNSHFVFLDSTKPDGHQVNKTQRDWLEQDLAKNKKTDTFVIFHEPAFPTGYKRGESLDAEASQRDALWQILDKYNVTGVFNGHEHLTSRRKIDSKVFPGAKNSIYQFGFGSTDSFDHTLPSAGVAEFANVGQGRYGIVRVNGKEITVEVYGPDGKILDSYTFSK